MSSPNLNVQLSVTGSNAGSGKLGSLTEQFNVQSLLQLLAGTGTGQIDTLFEDTRTLAASTSENLDLVGSLTDRFGATVNLLHVKFILIRASAANTNDVIVGNAAATTFVGPFGAAAHTIAISPGEIFLITKASSAGWAAVGGASDLLKVLNGGAGTGVTYDVMIGGTST